MSVYVDQLFITTPSKKWPYRKACHLLADSVGELTYFATHVLGLRESWRQNKGKPIWCQHFDITEGMRWKAIRNGAIELDNKTMLEYIKKHQALSRRKTG